MSKILKGFVEIESLQNTTPGVTAVLGELSVWSMTYTKDKNEYTDPNTPGYRLTSTSCIDSVTGVVTPSQAIINEIIDVVKRCKTYTITHLMPYDHADFLATIRADLFNLVTSLKFGPLLTNSSIQLPQWVEWDSLTEVGTKVKVWLSDAAFAEQYDLYNIVVVPPLTNLNDFFLQPATVRSKLAAISASQMMDNIQAAKSRNPETYIRTETFNYKSPIASDPLTPTNWTVLIYGIQGDNIDAIKDAMIAYVLANSTHTREEWEVIFPDLFKRTEFVFIPRWDLMSIPNMTVQTGLYRSILDPNETIIHAKSIIDFYEQIWISNHLVVLPYPYKAIMLEAVTGPTNEEFADSLVKLFPDYIPVPSTSLDFNRMTADTQSWFLLLEQLLIVAEHIDEYTTIPDPIRIIYRNGVRYVSAYFRNVNYLVLPKTAPVEP